MLDEFLICCSLSPFCPWSCPLCSDVSANSTAAYVTGMVRGATTGLVIDLGEQTHGKGGRGPGQGKKTCNQWPE